ncbi:MAG TPA: GntR family transcriptional regulator [Phycisphaerae bacterium]|nr:GntR family transcriptional regulator [Phycisphaerae bacterium]
MALDIIVSTGSTVPMYRQICDQVCRAIATGQLSAGEQLPSVRALAEELVLNPNTVGRAYAELIREGALEGQQGKGVFVAERRTIYTKAERLRRLDGRLEAFVSDGLHLGFTPEELREALDRKLQRLEAASGKGAVRE